MLTLTRTMLTLIRIILTLTRTMLTLTRIMLTLTRIILTLTRTVLTLTRIILILTKTVLTLIRIMLTLTRIMLTLTRTILTSEIHWYQKFTNILSYRSRTADYFYVSHDHYPTLFFGVYAFIESAGRGIYSGCRYNTVDRHYYSYCLVLQ
jgi:hypothetical protein